MTVQLRDASGVAVGSFQEFEPITIHVGDTGLVGAGSIEVLVMAVLRGDEEWVSLIEQPADSGIFTAVLATSASLDLTPAAHSDGILELAEWAGPPVQRDAVSLFFDDCSLPSCPWASAQITGNRIRLLDSLGQEINYQRPSFALTVEVIDFSADSQSPPAVEISVGGDSEILVLDPVSGPARFMGTISVDLDQASPDNGRLEAVPGSTLTARLPQPLGLDVATASIGIIGEYLYFVDRAGRWTNDLLIEGPIAVELIAPAANLDHLAVDSVTVDLSSEDPSGNQRDSEPLVLTETGPATATFAASCRAGSFRVPEPPATVSCRSRRRTSSRPG